MKSQIIRAIAALGCVAAVSLPAIAADDPIAVRKSLMQSLGGAAGVFGAVSKGELEYSPAVGKAVIAATNASAMAFGDFFPEGSNTGGNTTAAPAVWENAAGFAAEVAKLKEATAAAAAASGKDGPADADAFKAAMGPILGTCKSCHETYRVSN